MMNDFSDDSLDLFNPMSGAGFTPAPNIANTYETNIRDIALMSGMSLSEIGSGNKKANKNGAVRDGVLAGGALAGAFLNSTIGQEKAGQLSQNIGLTSGIIQPQLIIKKKKRYTPKDESLAELQGLPSYEACKVSECKSGFVRCSSVKLTDFNATDEEKNMIIGLLMKGVYL